MKDFAIGILGFKNLNYEVKRHWLRPRSFRVIVAIWLLTKQFDKPVTVKDLAKLFGVKTFRSDASLYNAVDSGYLIRCEGDRSRGIARHYVLSHTGRELMEKYLEQCRLFEERYNEIGQAYRRLFDFTL